MTDLHKPDGDPEVDDGEDLPVLLSTNDARGLGYFVRFIAPFASPYRAVLLLIGLLLIVDAALNVSFPLLQKRLIDEGLIARDGDVLVNVLVWFALAAVALLIVGFALDYMAARVFSSVVSDLRRDLFEKIQSLTPATLQQTKSGTLVSRFSGDIVAIETALMSLVPGLLLPLLEVIYSTVLMFFFDVRLGLLAFLIFPLTLIAPRFFAKRAIDLGYDKRRADADLLAAAQENISAQPIVQAYGLQRREARKFDVLSHRWRRIAFRFNVMNALVEQSANGVLYLLHVIVFIVGAYLAYHGAITVGTLVTFEAMFLSMGYALSYVTHYFPYLAHAAGSARHLDEIKALGPKQKEPAGLPPLPRLQQSILFDKVNFAHPGGHFSIDQLDLTIPAGSRLAIVGSSGAGKSTLLGLLLRFHAPDGGRILLDGRDVTAHSVASLRAQMAIVFQESFLFHTSIGNNIRMGKAGASQEDVVRAAQAADMHDYIMSLPKGYDTLVGERGDRLSGGQRQRIAIARALIRNPAVLILDEATSALDSVTEAALLATLHRVSEGRTVVSVTHRLSNAASADRIIVLEDGVVHEEGRHSDLLARSGLYSRMWTQQQSSAR